MATKEDDITLEIDMTDPDALMGIGIIATNIEDRGRGLQSVMAVDMREHGVTNATEKEDKIMTHIDIEGITTMPPEVEVPLEVVDGNTTSQDRCHAVRVLMRGAGEGTTISHKYIVIQCSLPT
jgi:hypothetical protein